MAHIGKLRRNSRRSGVQDLAFIIATTGLLIELKTETLKGQSKKAGGNSKYRGDRDKPDERQICMNYLSLKESFLGIKMIYYTIYVPISSITLEFCLFREYFQISGL